VRAGIQHCCGSGDISGEERKGESELREDCGVQLNFSFRVIGLKVELFLTPGGIKLSYLYSTAGPTTNNLWLVASGLLSTGGV
jgi:hypothetical protein